MKIKKAQKSKHIPDNKPPTIIIFNILSTKWLSFKIKNISLFSIFALQFMSTVLCHLIKYNNKMKDSNDSQNQVILIPIPTDFKKINKSKPNTDRTHNLTLNHNKKQTQNNPTPLLIEKKKQYSMAIRQKNLAKKLKIEPLQQGEQYAKMFVTQTLKNNSSVLNEKMQVGSSEGEKEKYSSARSNKFGKQNEIKSKVKEAKREITKIKKMSAAIEDLKIYGISNKHQVEKDKTFLSRPSEFQSNFSRITKLQQPFLPKFTISTQINESIGPFVTPQMKELQLLNKQNTTFKKELANYRKQNGSIKRELEDCKKLIQQLKETNDSLVNQNQDNIKMLQSFQLKVGQSFEDSINQPLNDPAPQSISDDTKMKEILSSYQSRLFQVSTLNKKLQLKNYMLQKRLGDQAQTHKKTMAREISIWKERYLKARSQNIRLKDSRNSMLFEMSISREEQGQGQK